MPRSRNLALALATAIVGGTAPAAVTAQGTGTSPGDGDARPVGEITYPVLDLELETSSLDRSVRRFEGDAAVRVTLDADVLFAFNSARLGGAAKSRIAEAATEIRKSDADSVAIEGHTDNKGSPPLNLRLSRRRGDAVKRALSPELGRGGPTLKATGKGETEPVVSNTAPGGGDSPKGRARNRRVEISFSRG